MEHHELCLIGTGVIPIPKCYCLIIAKTYPSDKAGEEHQVGCMADTLTRSCYICDLLKACEQRVLQMRTKNGTGVTRDTLQNEKQEVEMQDNHPEAVITKPYHLPECPQFCDGKPPKCRGGDCTLCDEVDCYCDRLRACEQRLIREGRTRGSGVWRDGYDMGYADALDTEKRI